MKKFIALLFTALLSMAFVSNFNSPSKQEEVGIKFKSIGIAKAKALSKESGKLIFIDACTSWCGPCKKMAATSFKDPAVAELYNEKFINLKIDCERDADGPAMARLYEIKAYPTLLLIDSEGTLIKKVMGLQSAEQLIEWANTVD